MPRPHEAPHRSRAPRWAGVSAGGSWLHVRLFFSGPHPALCAYRPVPLPAFSLSPTWDGLLPQDLSGLLSGLYHQPTSPDAR